MGTDLGPWDGKSPAELFNIVWKDDESKVLFSTPASAESENKETACI